MMLMMLIMLMMLMMLMMSLTLLKRVLYACAKLCRTFIDINHMPHAISIQRLKLKDLSSARNICGGFWLISNAKVACTEFE